MSSHYSYQFLFDKVALHYEPRIGPAFTPLARSLVEWVAAESHETVLDIGTGTGIAARLIAPQVHYVTGIDFAPAMVEVARQIAARDGLSNITFLQEDVHQMQISGDRFDRVIASFGLNATDPRRSLPEIFRVLKPGGWLCFQEWGGWHLFDQILYEVIEDYAVDDDDAPSELLDLRDFLDKESPWYQDLQTEFDYREDLREYDFTDIEVHEHQPVAVKLTINDFLRYKTAWLPRAQEIAAMDSSARGDCFDQLRRRLYEYAQDDILTYDPQLFRVRARKPAPAEG